MFYVIALVTFLLKKKKLNIFVLVHCQMANKA